MISTTLERCAHLIGLYVEQTVGELCLSQAEVHVVVALSEHGPMPIGALHRAFGHKPSTLTNVVDRLERRNLVRRESNPHDRRSVLIQLTSAGEETADVVVATLRRLHEDLGATIAARDLAGVENVARALAALIEQRDVEK